jgi:hypothetical protein
MECTSSFVTPHLDDSACGSSQPRILSALLDSNVSEELFASRLHSLRCPHADW